MISPSSTMSDRAVKQSDLLGRLVMNRLTAEEVGYVDQIWLDGKRQQVVGMTYRSGLVNLKRPMFLWTQLESIGPDSIVISLPEGAVLDRPPEEATTLIGHEVWTEDGTKAGVIGDYHLDPQTGATVDYLLIRDEWQGMTSGIYRLLPSDVVSMGQHRMLVTREGVDSAEQVVGDLAQRVSEFFKRDYQRTLQHLSAAVGETQSLAQQMKDKAFSMAEQAQKKISGSDATSSNALPSAEPDSDSATGELNDKTDEPA